MDPDKFQRLHKASGYHKFPLKGHWKQRRLYWGSRVLGLEVEATTCCRCMIADSQISWDIHDIMVVSLGNNSKNRELIKLTSYKTL